MPGISWSGNMSPQSTARRSSPYSRSIMLRPISPSPPSGMIRMLGSIATSDPWGPGDSPAGSRSVMVDAMLPRALVALQKPSDPREVLEREALRPPAPLDRRGLERRRHLVGPEMRPRRAERVRERLPPVSEGGLDDPDERRPIGDRNPRSRPERGLHHRRLDGGRRAEGPGRDREEEGQVRPELPQHRQGAIDLAARGGDE